MVTACMFLLIIYALHVSPQASSGTSQLPSQVSFRQREMKQISGIAESHLGIGERERNRLRPCTHRSSGHGSMPSLVPQGSSLRRDPPLVAQGSESALSCLPP